MTTPSLNCWTPGYVPLVLLLVYSLISVGGRVSLVAQAVKYLSTAQETWIQSLGQEDGLKTGMAAHSSILAWEIPWTEEPDGYSPWDRKKVRHI